MQIQATFSPFFGCFYPSKTPRQHSFAGACRHSCRSALEGLLQHVKLLVQLGQLLALTADVPSKFNLIPFNPFPQSGYRRSPPQRVRDFAQILIDAGRVATTRKTRGDDIDAACGQLAGQVTDKTRRAQKRIAIGVGK